MNENELRERAKALNIKNWHNRKLENLVLIINEKEKEEVKASNISLPLDALMNVLDLDGRERILAYIDAVDALVGYENIIKFIENSYSVGKLVSGTPLSVAFNIYKSQSGDKYLTIDEFIKTVNNIFILHDNFDWFINNDEMFFGSNPILKADWHVKTWTEVSSAFDKDKAKQVLALVMA